MSESRWLRLNTDWHLSDWLVVLSAESRLAWVQLLCHVKINGFGGRCKAIAPIIAERLWFVNEPSIRQMIQAAENAGALVVEDGAWVLTKWRDYQGDDSNAERQKRYRERKTQVQTDGKVTGSNASRYDVTPTETETETETITKSKPKRFTKPTLEHVLEYAKERGQVDNPARESQRFIDYWESVGWQRGRTPVKDWRATWRTWETNNQGQARKGRVDWDSAIEEAKAVLDA